MVGQFSCNTAAGRGGRFPARTESAPEGINLSQSGPSGTLLGPDTLIRTDFSCPQRGKNDQTLDSYGLTNTPQASTFGRKMGPEARLVLTILLISCCSVFLMLRPWFIWKYSSMYRRSI
ncbi:hypothetical protein AMECASPLE_026256 [Ameca splendens]|uniref:Uncharacterized protein n=1 Tax=Ameca splendens TaxID=208324 RepID=A0ABV0ZDS2_9TELE